ncbi:2-C-methyl-D-erythritol 4-phosphate cytidylyltransferase [Prochlorococcus sp. AH-716-A09]|nr:2-C-methyl-D-erythritol 4-phosphate cytidylyltransferase [Prochlorococcus sp. AH-716-A09]
MDIKRPILLIPMCGIGKRFKDAGYKIHKSQINISGTNMLNRVSEKFPKDFKKYIITTKKIKEEICKSNQIINKTNNYFWIIIEEHALGPGYTLYKGINQIPDYEPIYISYCDITWTWGKVKLPHENKNIEAAIFTHYGFHPHLINNPFSAFCKKNYNNTLKKIKEKGSFTKNWMSEEVSIGVFYIRNKKFLMEGLNKLIRRKYLVKNEYYPSLIFNFFVERELKVHLIKVKSFVHYGTPDQLEDFKRWIDNLRKNFQKEIIKFPAIFLAAGEGRRMKKISNLPKSLIKIGHQRLIDKVIKNLPINRNKIILIINKSSSKFYDLDKRYFLYGIRKTNNQLDSLKESLKIIEDTNSFFLCSSDCYGKFNTKKLEKAINSKKFKIVCFGFNPSITQTKLGGHTYFSYKADEIIDIHIKERLHKKNLGLAGFFWISDSIFLKNLVAQFYISEYFKCINREVIIDDLIKFIITKNINVGFIKLENYIHLGSELEFKEYNFWKNNIKDLLDKRYY